MSKKFINRFDLPYKYINKFDSSKVSELFSLVNNMNSQELKQYSLINKIPLQVLDKNGNNLIHYILASNDKTKNETLRFNLVKFLVNEEVNPDSPNSDNVTGLHLACQKQYVSIIKFLLEQGCNPNYPDNNGMTPFHHLLIGNINLCPKDRTVKDFIPPPKRQKKTADLERLNQIKRDLWTNINAHPLIDTLAKTIRNSYADSPQVRKIIIDLGDSYATLLEETDKPNLVRQLKEMVGRTRWKISQQINSLWKNFPNLNELTLHTKDENSWPTAGDNKLAIIQNHDYRDKLTQKINNIRERINKILTIDAVVSRDDFNTYCLEQLKELVQKSPNWKQFSDTWARGDPSFNFYQNSFNILLPITLEPYSTLQEFNDGLKHKLAVDYADNIINWDNMTFVGGSRFVDIYSGDLKATGAHSPFTLAQIMELFDGTEHTVLYRLAYLSTLEKPTTLMDFITISGIENIVGLDDTIQNNSIRQEYRNVAKYIVEQIKNPTIKNEFILNETNMLDDAQTHIFNRNFMGDPDEIFNEKKKYNPVSWLYNFIIRWRCRISNHRLAYTNLYCSMNEMTMYLIAGIANYTTNLKLSIIQATKTRFLFANPDAPDLELPYRGIISENGFGPTPPPGAFIFNAGSIYAAWIYFLLSANENVGALYTECTADNVDGVINRLVNVELRSLVRLANNFFGNPDYTIPDDALPELNWIPLFLNRKDISPGEVLAAGMIAYYNNMSQKPLLQHLIDTIALIRYHQQYNDPIKSIDRLRSLHIIPRDNYNPGYFEDGLLNNIHTTLDLSYYAEDAKYNVIPEPPSHIFEGFSQYTLPSKLGWLLEDRTNINQYKLVEAHYLGLMYLGHLPNVKWVQSPKFINNIPIDVSGIQLMNYNYNDPIIPFNNNNGITYYNMFNITDTAIYGDVDLNLYRPPLKQSYIELMARNIDKIRNFINDVGLKKVIDNLSQNTTNYAKILPVYYPVTSSLSSYENILVYEASDNGLNVRESINTNILAQQINQLNANFYLYYYLNTGGNVVDIPKFFYYQIPTGQMSSSPFIYFDANSNLIYPPGQVQVPVGANTNIGPLKLRSADPLGTKYAGRYNYNKQCHYKCTLDDIAKGNYFMNTELVNGFFRQPKTNSLPPSLTPVLPQFYHYNLIELIKQIIQGNLVGYNIEPLPLGMSAENQDMYKRFYLAKIIEKLIKNFLKHTVSESTNKIYGKIISGEQIDENIRKELALTPVDFSLSLNEISVDLDNILELTGNFLYDEYEFQVDKRNYLLNFYKFSKDPEKKEKFVIYSNDYTNTYLLKSKYCLKVELDGIEAMMNNYANIRIKDGKGENPVYSLIKNYYAQPLQTIRNMGVDFRNDFGSPEHQNTPYDYIKSEYINHIKKFNFDFDSYKERISQFVGSQYNEIKGMVYANERFGNNLMKNLDTSFVMCNYLILQYLSENAIRFDIDYLNEHLTPFINLMQFDQEHIKTFLYQNILEGEQFPVNDTVVIAIEIMANKNAEINKLNEKINKYDGIIASLPNAQRAAMILKRDNKVITRDNLLEEINHLNHAIEQEVGLLGAAPFPPNLVKIIPRYDEIITRMDNQRGVYLFVWNKLLDDGLVNEQDYDQVVNTSLNLLPIKVLDKELELLERNLGDVNTVQNFRYILPYYQHLNKLAESYFDNSKYIGTMPLQVNKVRHFMYDVLVHLTQNIICYSVEMIMRKVIHQQLRQTYPDLTIVDRIANTDRLLNQEVSFEAPVAAEPLPPMENYLELLYKHIAIKLVKNSVDVFEDKYEEAEMEIQTPREILTEYFDLLTIAEGVEFDTESYGMQILKTDVASYFDTIIPKIINNWMVVMENQLRFIINQKRILETLLALLQ